MQNKKTFFFYGGLILCAAALALMPLSSCRKGGPPDSSFVLSCEDFFRPDLLPVMRQSIEVGMISSYDRTGGNDDGFSGNYSFIRKEDEGLVIADLKGPGMITRIHTPTPTEDIIEFYFDGESSPRIRRKISELFEGTQAPFLFPLVDSGVGGYYSYVPLAYRSSCKVLVRAERVRFYQINFARFPEDADIATYEDPPSAAFLNRLEKAGELIGKAGTDISRFLVSEGTQINVSSVQKSLEPGGTQTLFKTSRPGRFVGIRLGPASAFSGNERDILLKIYWDGAEEPALAGPVGDLFGYSFGDPAVRSLFLGTADDVNYIYLPMPFQRSARIDLVSERNSGPPVDIKAEIFLAPQGKSDNEGRLYALWRRENPTMVGTPYTFIKTMGRGHVVGVILQAQGLEPGQTYFFEGDDRAGIDGELAVPGTGSEDSFNGGWYDVPGRWESRTSLPLSGCLDYKKPLGRTGGYRWMIADALVYRKSIDFTIEHSPTDNADPTDYTSVTFFYSLDPPILDSPLPPSGERRVTAPERVVFVPGWNVPVRTSSLQNATWTKKSEEVGETGVRYLSMKTSGDDIFGPHHIAFILDVPEAGSYTIGIKAVLGPDQGQVQIYQRDRPVGKIANLYAEARSVSDLLSLGTQEMQAGDNLVYFHLVGRDERSAGLNLDLVQIVLEMKK